MAQARITIGFSSSQVIPLRLDDTALDALLEALSSGEWYDLTVEDGTLRLNLATVNYVRTEREEHRVGFGAQ